MAAESDQSVGSVCWNRSVFGELEKKVEVFPQCPVARGRDGWESYIPAGPTAIYIPGLLLSTGRSLLVRRVIYKEYICSAKSHPSPWNAKAPIKIGVPADDGWVLRMTPARGPKMITG